MDTSKNRASGLLRSSWPCCHWPMAIFLVLVVLEYIYRVVLIFVEACEFLQHFYNLKQLHLIGQVFSLGACGNQEITQNAEIKEYHAKCLMYRMLSHICYHPTNNGKINEYRYFINYNSDSYKLSCVLISGNKMNSNNYSNTFVYFKNFSKTTLELFSLIAIFTGQLAEVKYI